MEEVLDHTAALITFTVSMGEPVVWRDFGRFRPVIRSAATMRNPRTGEPTTTGDRVSLGFTPAVNVKKRLNGLGKPIPFRGRKQLETARPSVEELHRYLWGLIDDERHCVVTALELARHYGVHRDVMNKKLLSMRDTGRIRWIKMNAGRRSLWEISNPNTFRTSVGEPVTGSGQRRTAWG